ncbi:MAG: NADPH:quinone oxidoreductase family protein [Actinomycetota bacterium]|nr:NADPH:quinone oxidoreductase family protein [Actinomycetota bacterium]
MRAWQVVRHGPPTEALELRDVAEEPPGPGEILVRARASVLNYNEVDGCHGRYLTINPPLPYTLGMECVGQVVAAGPGAEDWMGRRVTASGRGATGAHADLVTASTAMSFEAPAILDDARAAAFFYPFHLAHLGLHERGRLAAGETVLVHAAAGGVGSAAVQLARAAGARVIATVGSDEKVAFVQDLGADLVVNYRADDFAARALEATRGLGVDMCFDGVGGATMQQSLRCLARGGRHLCVGFAAGIEAEEEPMISGRVLCFGNFDILGVILAYVDAQMAPHVTDYVSVPVPRFNPPTTEIGRRVQAHLVELLAGGLIRPLVGATVAFDQLPQALEAMESRRTVGRTVVTR